MRNLIRIGAVLTLAGGLLVACGDDQPACAGSPPKPPAPKPYQPKQPNQQRTTSKVQDKPKVSSKTTNPNWKSTSKPTTWGGYKQDRNWQQPYRKNMPVAPQPIIIHQYGNDYRTYPGFGGYYPVGVWPVGYGARYGCVPEKESTPEPTPTATVTVTATPSESPR